MNATHNSDGRQQKKIAGDPWLRGAKDRLKACRDDDFLGADKGTITAVSGCGGRGGRQ